LASFHPVMLRPTDQATLEQKMEVEGHSLMSGEERVPEFA
jgi:hypothetical protein